jgi:hypothetical protein
LDLHCVDQLYLNGYVPVLQTGHQVERFCEHLGQPIASPAIIGKIGNRFRREVDAPKGTASRCSICTSPTTRWDDRKLDHVRPYLERAERDGRPGVVAVVATQEFQSKICHKIPSPEP